MRAAPGVRPRSTPTPIKLQSSRTSPVYRSVALLRDALNQDLLDGRGNVALDVTATGNTVSAIKKSLNGTAALNLKDGALKGINLAQSLRDAKAMFTGGDRGFRQGAAAGEKNDFFALTGNILHRQGVAH